MIVKVSAISKALEARQGAWSSSSLTACPGVWFLSTQHNLESFEMKKPQLRKCLSQTGLWHISLIND